MAKSVVLNGVTYETKTEAIKVLLVSNMPKAKICKLLNVRQPFIAAVQKKMEYEASPEGKEAIAKKLEEKRLRDEAKVAEREATEKRKAERAAGAKAKKAEAAKKKKDAAIKKGQQTKKLKKLAASLNLNPIEVDDIVVELNEGDSTPSNDASININKDNENVTVENVDVDLQDEDELNDLLNNGHVPSDIANEMNDTDGE